VINIGIIGLGTVGSGTAKTLVNNKKIIEKRLGFSFLVKKIASLEYDESLERLFPLNTITKDTEELFKEKLDIVVELIGGIDKAKEYILRAIENGSSVVTANKALLSTYGFEIFKKAYEKRVDVGFEASVGGGIPIIRVIKEGLCANNILSIKGIVNGTANYILTSMLEEGKTFQEILKKAQNLGFAEKDPSLDIDGIDSAHKTAILASLAFGTVITAKQVYTEGIKDIEYNDLEYARRLGYKVKLLGIVKMKDKEVDARVHPTMIKETETLAKIDGVYNAITVKGDVVGDTTYIGQGAGSFPTASSIVSDIMDISRNIMYNTHLRIPLLSFSFQHIRKLPMVDMNSLSMGYYLRFRVIDSAGVLAKIANVLGNHGISIKSVIQLGHGREWVPVVLMTHRAREKDVKKAIEIIDRLNVVKDKTLLIRVEENENVG